MKNYDAAVLQGRSQDSFAIGAVAAQSPVLIGGVYAVWSDQLCHIAVGPDAATGLTADSGYVVFELERVLIEVFDGDRIAAVSADAGTLRYHMIG